MYLSSEVWIEVVDQALLVVQSATVLMIMFMTTEMVTCCGYADKAMTTAIITLPAHRNR